MNRRFENERWLPDMDLNHDKQIQSLLCYRYTIGQSGRSEKLSKRDFESSHATRVSAHSEGC